MIWRDTVLQGLLVGGVSALVAVGLALAFGVMRLIDMAHGDMMVMAAYLAFSVAGHGFGLVPALMAAVLVMAGAGGAAADVRPQPHRPGDPRRLERS